MNRLIITFVSLLLLGVAAAIGNNYQVTQGSGTSFGSITVGGIEYAQQLVCDKTTVANCVGVTSTGAANVSATVNGTVTVSATGNSLVTVPGTVSVSAVAADPGVGTANDSAATVGSTGTANAKLRLMTTQLDNINNNIQSPIPTGSNTIGGVAIRQISPISGPVVSGTSAISATLVAALGASNRFYMTDYSCSNTGASTTAVFFLNSGNNLPIWQSIIPAGGGTVKNFATPISTSANNALIISTLVASTTVYCSASGYSGT